MRFRRPGVGVCATALACLMLTTVQAGAEAEPAPARPLPDWYGDAKFGIFVHWGPYSVPGWAERTASIAEIFETKNPGYFFRHNPYAEWYWSSMRIPGSATAAHHAATYGAERPYEEFAADFDAAAGSADIEAWAALFAAAGARYSVLTTKHHDGYLLWPSDVANPAKGAYHATRDVVGAYAGAMRDHGLRVGLYYSGGYDWTVNPQVIAGLGTGVAAIPRDPAYASYVTAHYNELVERYEPDILWNDIALPAGVDFDELVSGYYASVPEGVVNDRWFQPPQLPYRGVLQTVLLSMLRSLDRVADALWRFLPEEKRRLTSIPFEQADFTTPEYASFDSVVEKKWEATRGIGNSFGANRQETAEDMLTSADIVRMLVDIVSKNGNLLLGVGPDENGDIPPLQAERLLGVGAWLDANGDAIYGTEPFVRPQAVARDGTQVRFTALPDVGRLFAILLDTPASRTVTIPGLVTEEGSSVRLLGTGDVLDWHQDGDDLVVTLPDDLGASPAHSLEISPVPSAV